MYSTTKYFKQLETQVRKICTNSRLSQGNHYDTLGISAKATQADIKSAYYKLSMQYHPDKSKNVETTGKQFRDISEAYEVLGNVRTRRLYDKGLFIEHSGSATYEETPMNKFYKSRETMSRPPAPYGRTTVYDFDEWSRSHYGVTFERNLRFKRRQHAKAMREKELEDNVKSEKVVFLSALLMLMAAYLFYDKNYDNPQNVVAFGSSVISGPNKKSE